MRTIVALIALCLINAACSAARFNGTPSGLGKISYRGVAYDPPNDATPNPQVRVAPDLVSAIAETGENAVAFHVRFAKGTFDSLTTAITIQMDADMNPATGVSMNGLGADYTIGIGRQFFQNGAPISRSTPGPQCQPRGGCWTELARYPVTFLADGVDAVLPRSAFDRFDGKFDFRVVAYVKPAASRFSIVTDQVPNVGMPPVHVR